MKKVLLLTLIFLLVACGANESASGELTVTDVRANMTLPSDTGSIWMVINNNSSTDDVLVGAEFAGCGAIELHNMFMEDDVMIMRQVEGGEIPIPAGETVELKQGGLHVMCIGKETPLEVGSSLDITLKFVNAGDIDVVAEVVAPGEMKMDMGEGEHSEMEMKEDS